MIILKKYGFIVCNNPIFYNETEKRETSNRNPLCPGLGNAHDADPFSEFHVFIFREL